MADVPEPSDARDLWWSTPNLRPIIVKCTWCGREVGEYYLMDVPLNEQLCERCTAMVRDPDTKVE